MLEKIKNKAINKRIELILSKHGIIVVHSLPGRIRLGFPRWRENEAKVFSLIREMKEDEDIISIEFTKETGTALILFNSHSVNHSNSVSRWLSIIQKYS